VREVLDLEKSKHFYCHVLRFEEIKRPAFGITGCWLHGYGLNLHLTQTAVPEDRKIVQKQSIEYFTSNLPNVDHIAFVSDELDAIIDILDDQKVFYEYNSPENTNTVQIFLFDPDENVIEISNCAPPIGDTSYCAQSSTSEHEQPNIL
jgi:catechol 2,3-dioxygenase-like lactoylglutathione lyase family enzyme